MTTDSTTDGRPGVFKRRLAKGLLKAFFWALLLLPPYLSYLLYSWEKTAPPTSAFWALTSYGLYIFSGLLALVVTFNHLSPRFRLFEPFTICLVVLISYYRGPAAGVYELQSLTAVGYLALAILMTLVLWNAALLTIAGRPDHIIELDYLDRLFNCRRSTATDLQDLNLYADEEHSDPPHEDMV
ncbi:hypothetical protein C8R46DRAFT_1348357 [Mycena filopes]|nr:hypothetical protein C8R46DRAFT_1348357 [Mycena filopes]